MASFPASEPAPDDAMPLTIYRKLAVSAAADLACTLLRDPMMGKRAIRTVLLIARLRPILQGRQGAYRPSNRAAFSPYTLFISTPGISMLSSAVPNCRIAVVGANGKSVPNRM